MKQEFVAAELSLLIGEYQALLEREKGSNRVRVTWQDRNGAGSTLIAPLDTSEKPIWNDKVYSLSDLLFELAGIGPMKVRRNKSDPDAPLIPLSFRDLMWYCYLEQDELDSTFFHLSLDDPRLPKSRDVMRFVLGYYTERLNELEQQLAAAVEQARSKLEAAAQLSKFFAELGYESDADIRTALTILEVEQNKRRADLLRIRVSHQADTHFADDLRGRLRIAAGQLAEQEQAMADAEESLRIEESLRAELLSAKFRLGRLASATTLLGNVEFDACPRCGTATSLLHHAPDECFLCGASPDLRSLAEQPLRVSPAQADLDTRIADLEQSIKIRTRSLKRLRRDNENLRMQKHLLDEQLTSEMQAYDSAFLGQSRQLERDIATNDERLTTMRRDLRIPQALEELRKDADRLQVEARRIRREIQDERSRLSDGDVLAARLEDYFLDALLEAGFPSISSKDRVAINRRTWVVSILPNGDESLSYTFYDAGSGGKKTLFNVCYAIALHRLVEERNLPLPLFLMIDSPMKNIGVDVNEAVFFSTYKYIYRLLATVMGNTQLLIADTNFAKPGEGLKFNERLMIAESLEHPPLIPYYVGH